MELHVSTGVLLFCSLVILLLDYTECCEWWTYPENKCDSWSSCSRTCGGGRRSRVCRSCLLSEKKTFHGDCGETCMYGHRFSSNQCNCPSWRSGICCENCRHIVIEHCVSGHQECGGSPDGIRCTNCEDPYYSAGYNNGCDVCPQITQCEHRHCTTRSNTICVKCYEDNAIFKRMNSDTQCDRMCAWNKHYCWPGSCGNNGLTKDCQCAPGFTKKELAGPAINSGETSCQLNIKPSIETCDTVFVGVNGEKRRTKSSAGSTACSFLQDTYGNYQPTLVEISMMSSFKVSITGYERPKFISEENFGLTDTTLYIEKKSLAGTVVRLSSYKQKQDTNASQNVTTTFSSKANITLDHVAGLTDGEALCITFEAKGGGFLKSIDTRQTTHVASAAVPYEKVTTQRQLCFRYDNSPPEHCLEHGTCNDEPIYLPNRVTRSEITQVTVTGWTDPFPAGGSSVHASSIEKYIITVNEVIPSKNTQMVDTSVRFTQTINNSATDITLTLTSDKPMLFCITLEVKDFADNVRAARRFLLFDNTSFIETRDDKPFFVSSASKQTNYTWQTNHHSTCLSWIDHFHNNFYLHNAFLNPIQPDPHGLISGIYEQNTGILPMKGTPNVHGIIEYNISWALNDGAYTAEISVPDFRNQSFCTDLNVKDGDAYTFRLRPIDIVGNTYEETRIVYIDRSSPELYNIWLVKDGYKMLYVHNSVDLSTMQMTFDALDPHSGLKLVEWSFGISDTSTELHRGALAVQRTQNESCSIDSVSCYCPSVGPCEIYTYTIPLNGLVALDKHTGNHNRNYYFIMKTTNNAMLFTTERVDILIDDSPPETGVILEGPEDEKDIDYISSDSFLVHWHGFIDHESGIKLYRVGMGKRCYTTQELNNRNAISDMEDYQELPFTESTAKISANFTGKRYVSIIALNNAMDASGPVCSDGVTRDLSPPGIRNLTLQNGVWSESILCENGTPWFVQSSLTKAMLQNTSACRLMCNTSNENFASYLPKSDKNIFDTFSDFLCQHRSHFKNDTTVYLPNDQISLHWDISQGGSQIDDYFVGFGSDPTEKNNPSLVQYISTDRKKSYKRRHEGVGSDEMFYIFIKSVNKAGLHTVTTIGPVLIDTTPPLYRKIPNVTISNYDIIVGWETDTFYDPEQTIQIDEIVFQIEHDGVKMSSPFEWRLDAFPPCPGFTGGCFTYPLQSLQKQDTDLGLSFYFVMHIYNKAGHFTTISTDIFQLPSLFPPGHGLVFDLDPTLEDGTENDVEVHFSQKMICARWSGFLHHESVVLEFGVGTTNSTDDVLQFQDIPAVTSHCSHNETFLEGTRYYALIRATCSGGSTISSSNGVLIVNQTSLLSGLEINIGKHPRSAHVIQESFVVSKTPFKLRFARALDVGETYLLTFPDNFTVGSLISTDGIVQSDNKKYRFIPFILYPVISLRPLAVNVTVTIKLTKQINTKFIQDTDQLSIDWTLDLPLSLSVYVGMYTKNVSTSSPSLIYPFEHSGNSTFYTFKNLKLQHDMAYQAGLQICSTAVCLKPKLSDTFYIDTLPTSGEITDAVLTPSNPSTCLDIQIKWEWRYHTQNIRFFRWNLAKSDQCDHVYREWSTVIRANSTMYFVNDCIDLPVHGFATLFVCIQAVSVTGLKTFVYEPVEITPKSEYGAAIVYDFDRNSVHWKELLKVLPSSNIGSMYRIVHDSELQIATPDCDVAGAMFYSTERNITWSLMTSRHVPVDCNLDPDCEVAKQSDKGYVEFSNKYIEPKTAYYICAFSNATTITRELFVERFEEISTCSNGFVLDDTAPIPGGVHVSNINNYIPDSFNVLITWDAFGEDINASQLGYFSNILTYSFQIGRSPGRGDIQEWTTTYLKNSVICDISSVTDGTLLYITVNGSNHAGLSASTISDEYILDVSPPVTGQIEFGDDNHYISDDILVVKIIGFHDKHSGIDHYNVGKGSSNISADIQPVKQYWSDVTEITVTDCDIRDGHKYYVIVQAVNRAGLVSETVSRWFMLDKTPPNAGHVLDGTFMKDVDFQTDIYTIQGHWKGFSDSHSSIHYYRAGLGTAKYESNIRGMVDVGLVNDISWNGPFIPGEKYFITVEACNFADLCTMVSSDGLVVDNSLPVKGLVEVGPGDGHSKYLSHTSSIHIRWAGFQDPQSGVDHFEACVGTQYDICDIVARFNALLETNMIKSNTSLPSNRDLYATVWVFNQVGINVSQTSDSFRIDDTPPKIVRQPKFLSDSSSGSKHPEMQWEKSFVHINWKFEDPDSPIVSHEISLITHHDGHTPVENVLIGPENDLTINLDAKSWLHNGDVYFALVTACNSAGLCTSDKSDDMLIDSTAPHLGGFKPPMSWINYNDSDGNIVTNITLTWYGFYDHESDIDKYYVTVGRTYKGHGLSNGVQSMKHNSSLAEHEVSFSLSEVILPNDLVLLTIWAENYVGLNSSVARVSVNALSSGSSFSLENQRGTLELEKHSCDVHFCNNDCTCAVVGQPCVNVQSNLTCTLLNISNIKPPVLPTIKVFGGLQATLGSTISASSACLSGSWTTEHLGNLSGIQRFEWTVGIQGQPDGEGVFDLKNERPWQDVGLRNSFIHCLENKSLTHSEKYEVRVKVWYGPEEYSLFYSSPILIDQTPPAVKRGKYVMDSDNECQEDLDFIDWTDTVTACWDNVFSEQQGKITHYTVALGTGLRYDDILKKKTVGLKTSISLFNLTLQHGTKYFFTVSAFNDAGLHTTTSSDGFLIDTDIPTSGVVFNTLAHKNADFHSSHSRFGFSWHGFQDHYSGIESYHVAVVNELLYNASEVVFTNVGLMTSFEYDTAFLRHTSTYYGVVKACDAAGHCCESSVSPGITVDKSSPLSYTCDNYNLTEFLIIHRSGTFFSERIVEVYLTESTVYKLNGFIIPDSMDHVQIHMLDTKFRLPVIHNHNGSAEFSYSFVSTMSGLQNISLVIDHTDSFIDTWSVFLSKCTTLEDKRITALNIRQVDVNELGLGVMVRDQESGVQRIQIGVGTTPGGFQVQPLSDVYSQTNYVKVFIDLPHGSKLFATAVVTNHAGLTSVFSSEPLVLDHTAPVLKDFAVKLSNLTHITGTDNANFTIHVVWKAKDPESAVAYCYCAVGRESELSDVLQSFVAESNTTCKSSQISGSNGDLFYVTVTCVNGVEMHTSVSGPVSVSFLPPTVEEAAVSFISENQRSATYSFVDSTVHAVQSNNTCLHIGWAGFRDKTGIRRYEYRLREAANVMRDWTSSELYDVVTVNGLTLPYNKYYTADVRAVNADGYISDVINSALIVTDGPQLTGSPVRTDRVGNKLHLDWSGVFQRIADVPGSYSLVIGSRLGYSDVIDLNYTSAYVYDVTVPRSTLVSPIVNELYIQISCSLSTGLSKLYTTTYKL